jgi:hypothetical protein
MNRNMVAGIAVVAVLCVSAFAAVTFFSSSQTTLHYERNYTGDRPVYLAIAGLEDCVLTLGYEDDEDLMYRIDIELYDANEVAYFAYRGNGLGTYQHFVEMNTGNHAGSTTRARYMNITLGTGHPYHISFGADTDTRNVTGNIVFNNNATLGGEEFSYLFPGSHLNIVFTENVDYSQGGLNIVSIGKDNYEIASVNMYIDLPDGMDGAASFLSESMSISATGWTMWKETVSPPERYYRTAESPTKPLLDIDTVYGDSISAILIA